MPDLMLLRAAAYERGWRDFDRGGSHRVRRRTFRKLTGEHPDALAMWEAGWSDNQHARGFGTSRDLLATNTCQPE